MNIPLLITVTAHACMSSAQFTATMADWGEFESLQDMIEKTGHDIAAHVDQQCELLVPIPQELDAELVREMAPYVPNPEDPQTITSDSSMSGILNAWKVKASPGKMIKLRFTPKAKQDAFGAHYLSCKSWLTIDGIEVMDVQRVRPLSPRAVAADPVLPNMEDNFHVKRVDLRTEQEQYFHYIIDAEKDELRLKNEIVDVPQWERVIALKDIRIRKLRNTTVVLTVDAEQSNPVRWVVFNKCQLTFLHLLKWYSLQQIREMLEPEQKLLLDASRMAKVQETLWKEGKTYDEVFAAADVREKILVCITGVQRGMSARDVEEANKLFSRAVFDIENKINA